MPRLQSGILGPGALRLGIRRSPVFVGQASLSHDIVHYVAPHFALRTRAGDAGWPEFAWRFPDLTEHALYTCRLIESTIVDQMAGEARVLRRFDTASRRLKAVIEMPDPDVTRVIRSLKENGWAASGKLLKEYPVFDDPSRQRQAIEAVRSAFEDRPPANIAGA
jgi:hypothetical protein